MLFAIALLTGALTLQQGDITVRGEISPHATTVGRAAVVTVTVRSKSAEDPLIEWPTMPAGLQIAGTSSSTELEISMPGGRTNVVRQELQIVASRPGTYSIPPATVRIGGKVYRTERFDLSVGGSAAGAPQLQDDDSPIRLRASIEPKNPYVGQEVLLKLEAALPADARFQTLRAPSYDPPTLGGFWIQDLPDPITTEVRSLNGFPTEVQTFERAYFPLTAGDFVMPAARLLYDVRGGIFFAPETREVLSDSIPLTVRPLPDAGKPASFNGAVGSFTIASGVDRSTMAVGDALTYTMVVEGTGNIKSLPPPSFPTIPDVDVYPPAEDATLRVVNGIIGGTRTFQWVLIPRKPGAIDIPAVEYAWFNPVTEKYETARSGTVHVTVTAAAPISTAGGDTALSALRVRPSSTRASFAMSRTFLLLQLLPLLALIAIVIVRKRATGAGAERRAQRNALQLRLGSLEDLARNDARGFYASAIQVLDDAAAYSDNASIRSAAEELKARFRTRLYAPSPPNDSERQQDLGTVRQFVAEATDARKRGSTASALIIVITAMSLCATASILYARTQGSFDTGLAQMTQHDYAGAAHSFGDYVGQHPRDASAWYNLGNAYYRNRDPGRAAWAWLRARDLQPRSRDIAHNLNVINARRALSQTEHWFPVSTAEIAWLAAFCWWLCMLSTIAHLLRPRAATRIGAMLLGTATVVAIVMFCARWVGPGVVVPAGHGAAMYAAPTSRTDIRTHLEVGDAAQILRTEGDWHLVRTSSFTEGWVRKGDVLAL